MDTTRRRCPVYGLHICAGPNGQSFYGCFPSQVAPVSLASQRAGKHESDVSELFDIPVIQVNRCLSRVPGIVERPTPFPKGKTSVHVSSYVCQVKAFVVDGVGALGQQYPQEDRVYVLGIVEQAPDRLDLARPNSKMVIDSVVS